MSTRKHYFIEENAEGKFAIRAAESQQASSLHDTQEEAVAEVKRLNPDDHPDVERVRNVVSGRRDKWRSA